MFGGGQERGLRPGTLPVHSRGRLRPRRGAGGRGSATTRTARCARFRESLLAGLAPLDPVVNGDPARAVPYIVNLSFPGLEAEVGRSRPGAIWSAISNGAACTSQSLHLQPRAERHAAARRADGRRGAVLVVRDDAPSPTGRRWWPRSSHIARRHRRGRARHERRRADGSRRSTTGGRASPRTCRAIGAIRRPTTGCSRKRPGVLAGRLDAGSPRACSATSSSSTSRAEPGAHVDGGRRDRLDWKGLKAVTSVFAAGSARSSAQGRGAQTATSRWSNPIPTATAGCIDFRASPAPDAVDVARATSPSSTRRSTGC